jgi:hypothetical protein
MNYITQEQAAALATKYALPRGLGNPYWPVIFNEVIKDYLQAQPAVGINGLTEAETSQSMSVRGLAQPAKPVEPLTDEQIRKWWASENGLEDMDMAKLDDFTAVVRAVLAKAAKERT